jgi:hypothetical protein
MDSVSCPYTAVTLHRVTGEQLSERIPIPTERPWSYTFEITQVGRIYAALWWNEEAPVAQLEAAHVNPGDSYTVTVSGDMGLMENSGWTNEDDLLLQLWLSS